MKPEGTSSTMRSNQKWCGKSDASDEKKFNNLLSNRSKSPFHDSLRCRLFFTPVPFKFRSYFYPPGHYNRTCASLDSRRWFCQHNGFSHVARGGRSPPGHCPTDSSSHESIGSRAGQAGWHKDCQPRHHPFARRTLRFAPTRIEKLVSPLIWLRFPKPDPKTGSTPSHPTHPWTGDVPGGCFTSGGCLVAQRPLTNTRPNGWKIILLTFSHSLETWILIMDA